MTLNFFLFILIITTSCKKETIQYASAKKSFERNLDFTNKANSCLNKIEKCNFVEIKNEESYINPNSTKILILDSEREPFFISSFLLLKEKIVHFLKYDSSFNLVVNRSSILAPQILKDTVDLILKKNIDLTQFIKNSNTSYTLLKLHHKVKKNKVYLNNYNHGEYVFFILSYFNPDAQFFIAPYPEPNNEIFCKLSKNFYKIKNMLTNSLNSINQYIKENNIKYVNISYSTTLKTLENHNKFICDYQNSYEELRKYLDLKIQFLDALSKINKDTIFVQSIPNEAPQEPFNHDKDYHFSCKERDNFFRIGYWNNLVYRAPKEGIKISRRRLPLLQRNLTNCSDFFVNSGINSNKANNYNSYFGLKFWEIDKQNVWWNSNSLKIYYHGFFQVPVQHMSTSWATPLGLSLINYIIKSKNLEINRNTIHLIKTTLSKKMSDPIFNKQTLRNMKG